MAKKRVDLSRSKPQFFQVLLPGFFSKLKIPRKFVKNIIRAKCESASIRSPLGKSWQVKVHRNAEGMYFREGWREFALAHDLNIGYFLLFDYEGDMVFSVAVFDLSMCKKEYTPVVGMSNEDNGIKVGNRYSDDNDHKNSGRRRVTRSYGRTMAKAMKSRASSDTRQTARATKFGKRCGEMKALETMTSCSPETYFMATVKPSNLRARPYMHVPSAFCSRYKLWGKRQIILQDSQRRSWTVRLYSYRRVIKCRTQWTQFGSGWEQFAVDNCLKVGDVCVFQLASEEKNVVMRVHVIRK